MFRKTKSSSKKKLSNQQLITQISISKKDLWIHVSANRVPSWVSSMRPIRHIAHQGESARGYTYSSIIWLFDSARRQVMRQYLLSNLGTNIGECQRSPLKFFTDICLDLLGFWMRFWDGMKPTVSSHFHIFKMRIMEINRRFCSRIILRLMSLLNRLLDNWQVICRFILTW